MKRLSVKNAKEFTCFNYTSEINPTVSLGNIVIKEPTKPELGIEWDEKPEIGVIIQTFRPEKGCDDFRTDQFGCNTLSKKGEDYHTVTRFATLEEIEKYRPELLKNLKTDNKVEKIQLKAVTGKTLNIKSDKDGFYFSNSNNKISFYDHERILSKSILETETIYLDKLHELKMLIFNATNLEELKLKVF